MDYSIPFPIKINETDDYVCICKYCSDSNKYVTIWDGYSYLWNKCLICNTKVWYWPQICSLYGRRSPYVVCFYCRISFYKKGCSNGEIYKIAKNRVKDL